MQEKNLGIDKNNILVLQNTGRLGTNKDAFRNSLVATIGCREGELYQQHISGSE